jgi:hypothetical protein
MIPVICFTLMFSQNIAICDVPPDEYRGESPLTAPTALPIAPEPSAPLALGKSVKGEATWYCNVGPDAQQSRCTHGYEASGAYAAAGPELRKALGPDYKGTHVWVNGVEVILVDFCACGGDHVIDVYHDTWVTIPHPDRVTVTWPG